MRCLVHGLNHGEWRKVGLGGLCAALVFLFFGCAPHLHAPRSPPPSMEDGVAPSLRGADEVALPPARPPREAPPFGWEGSAGHRVLVDWPTRSESVGRPTRGRLVDGHKLAARGDGWIHRPRRSHGTDELVAVIKWGIWRVLRQFPETVPVFIGDLSEERGGRAPPHRSHQSGRDVDVGYYLVDNQPATGFVPVTPETLDAEKTWALIEGFLSTGMVQYIFIDHRIQETLYDAARDFGWSEEQLSRLFQYPRPRTSRAGIIRHSRGHGAHMHLRIVCPVGDRACRD